MLWRFLNRPHTVTAALAFKRAYVRRLRDSGRRHGVFRNWGSVEALTCALLNQPNLPEQDQSDLIAFSLDAMEHIRRPPRDFHRPPFARRHPALRAKRLEEIKSFLEQHPLPRKDEFLRRIKSLEVSHEEP